MRRTLSLAAVLAALATPGVAGQPISTSLVECAAIFSAAGRIGERKGRAFDDIFRMVEAERGFMSAARVQARREGLDDPAHVDQLREAMDSKWRPRLSSLRHLRDNLDWIDYCRALGRDRGILD